MKLTTCSLGTPIGKLHAALQSGALVAAWFEDGGGEAALHKRFGEVTLADEVDPGGVVSRFSAYFRGDLRAIDDLVVDLGGTPFQAKVWAALRHIPIGTTWSYGELGRYIGAPKGASRAVGAANGANPVPIVVPCHRVIGKSGDLVGYGCGLPRKQWLLRHEGALSPQAALPLTLQ